VPVPAPRHPGSLFVRPWAPSAAPTLVAVDVTTRRTTEAVHLGVIYPQSAEVVGDLVVVVGHDGRVIVLRNPF
jgi:hypothetical protein